MPLEHEPCCKADVGVGCFVGFFFLPRFFCFFLLSLAPAAAAKTAVERVAEKGGGKGECIGCVLLTLLPYE